MREQEMVSGLLTLAAMNPRTEVATEPGHRRTRRSAGWRSDWWSRSLVVLAQLLVAASIAAAQNGAGQRPHATFRSTVDLVTLHVSVIDDSGRYLSDLEQPEFMVFEDGRPQELRVFERGGYPVAVMLFLDISSSMSQVFPRAQEAAIQFLQRLAPQDVASVVAFGNRVEILQTFTADQQALERAVRRARARGATRLFNALYVGLTGLSKARWEDGAISRRRVAVLLTDGHDTASLVSFDQVLDVAKRSDIAVYAVRISGALTPGDSARESEYVLRQLTRQTGGRAFLSSSEGKDLRSVYENIRAELSRHYALGYVSNDARRDGRFRYISVQLSRPGARARTRVGYFAPLARFAPRYRE
jgi:Ca-activated chloride channel family protein